MKIRNSIIRKSIALVALMAILSVMVAPLATAASEKSIATRTSPSSSQIKPADHSTGPIFMGGIMGPGKGQGPKGDPDDPDIATQNDPEKSKLSGGKVIWLLIQMFRCF